MQEHTGFRCFTGMENKGKNIRAISNHKNQVQNLDCKFLSFFFNNYQKTYMNAL